MNKYLLYPGCSMDSSAKAYMESLNSIVEPLDLHLEEIEDWNCCGATEYLGINLIPAYSLIARNLALASKQMDGGTRTVVAPCSACYLNLAKADYYMQERPTLGAKVNEALAAGGLEYKAGTLDVRHLIDVLVYDVGLDAIRKAVTHPLSGLKVVPYMGCMLPRPDYQHRWSDHEHPTELDDLLRALGADELGSVGHWFDSDANSGWRRGRRCGWIGPGAEQEKQQRKARPGAAWGSRQGEGGMRHALPLTEPDRDEKDRDWGRVSTFDNCLPGSDGIRHGQAIED